MDMINQSINQPIIKSFYILAQLFLNQSAFDIIYYL